MAYATLPYQIRKKLDSPNDQVPCFVASPANTNTKTVHHKQFSGQFQ
jgi:hypothetical protein